MLIALVALLVFEEGNCYYSFPALGKTSCTIAFLAVFERAATSSALQDPYETKPLKKPSSPERPRRAHKPQSGVRECRGAAAVLGRPYSREAASAGFGVWSLCLPSLEGVEAGL